MASIRSCNGLWQARITRQGQPHIARSFQSKQDAERWARQTETEMDRGSFINIDLVEKTLFSEVIERYVQEVTLKTRNMKEDTYRLRALARHPIGKLSMIRLSPIKVAAYRHELLKIVSKASVIRELSYFSSIINHARREWGIEIINPVPLVKKPASPQGRSRILSEEELNRLYTALAPKIKSSNHWILPLTKFALETAMRRGEILGLRWEYINISE